MTMQPLTVLRNSVAESAVNTLTEDEFTLATDAFQRIAFRIQRIAFHPQYGNLPTPPAADAVVQASFRGALSTRQGLAIGDLDLGASGFIAGVDDIFTTVSQAADGGVSYAYTSALPHDWAFGPQGLIVADRTLSLYVRQASFASGAGELHVAIYGAYERLDPGEFMAALSVFEAI